jgi:hypothetical protein
MMKPAWSDDQHRREAFLTRRGQQELEGLANDFQEEKRMPLYLDEIYFNISARKSTSRSASA